MRSSRAERQDSPLVNYGDPVPTDPEAVLAHFIALGELRAAARAGEHCPCERLCGRP